MSLKTITFCRALVALFSFGVTALSTATPDPDHWSFQERQFQKIPRNSEEHPIDAFLLDQLQKKGLQFSESAEPGTLLRRLTMDLTGLPPTPPEVNHFEKASKDDSGTAFTKAMERLLDSPQYGERWGQHWLDTIRYADTHGFEVNTPRPNAWPYRDYIIQAFNADLPYDRFIFEQLAGDTVDKDAATGFLVTAAALLQGQIGQDDESIKRARQDELNEIVINTASSFLGLTIHCARCHDHKFDAISQKDYFRLQALFGGVHYGERPNREATKLQEQTLEKLDGRIARTEELLGNMGLRLPVNTRLNVEDFPAVEARYVRFTILKTNSLEPCLDELEIWSEKDRENVALASNGVRATSSGDYHDPATHQLEFINDGKYGNSRSWIARDVENGWVTLDLGKPAMIDRITWGRDREEKFTDRLALEYRIEVATESGHWIAVASSRDRLKTLDPSTLDDGVSELAREYQTLLAQRSRVGGWPGHGLCREFLQTTCQPFTESWRSHPIPGRGRSGNP